jgi:hypothetical protein
VAIATLDANAGTTMIVTITTVQVSIATPTADVIVDRDIMECFDDKEYNLLKICTYARPLNNNTLL